MRAWVDEDLGIRGVGETVGSCGVGRFFSCQRFRVLSITGGPEKEAAAKNVEGSCLIVWRGGD